ncbi:hypothetical protein HGRIS_008296 [Hohenbuehelia grisea]|uniref:tRNA (adenine(58)-N(1))-methyltransferase non-catalytic subunit TRM6 n=1 Tax=Hohenbuehelia grisea TaxID=104357 RepID=A0ABR3J7Z7_9AGAR
MASASAESSSSRSALEDSCISSGDTVLLRLPNGDVKSVKITKDSTVSLGKFGTFLANELIGQTFGVSYEISDKTLTVIPPRTLEEVEETAATNELIDDGLPVQPVTNERIQELKQAGVHVSGIIQKQIEQHANYSLKTEYSKDKYKKRKEAKYSKSFTTIEPTLFNVSEYWFNKDQSRIRDLRIDALAQILNMANIKPGGRYLAVDDASGLLVSGILSRMGGQGRLITLCDIESPPSYPVMTHMNFKTEMVKSVLDSLNWATAQEDYEPVFAPHDLPADQIKSDKQKSRLNKRKAVSDALMAVREDLFAGEFDALLIASEYDPNSIIEALGKYLGGSANVVVHSPYVQIMSDLQATLRWSPEYLSPALSEVWLRKYQVLPGRTHPVMNMSGSGGYILHTIKVYDDPSAVPVTSHRRQQRLKNVAAKSSASGTPMDGIEPPDESDVKPGIVVSAEDLDTIMDAPSSSPDE